MPLIVLIPYFFLILIFLAFGAAIVFHLLRYRINQQIASIMSVIYIVGTILLLISNFVLFSQVDWESLANNFSL